MRASLRLALLMAACTLVLVVALYGTACWLNTPFAPEPARDWGESIPAEVAAGALNADRVLDEAPCDWRSLLAPIFRPVVADCATAREATLRIASRLQEVTGVSYSMERTHPCLNAHEALEQKKVSCTGNSILLTCALRSVGIPARAVGVVTWNHVRGNHTWVEAWFEGEWHMVEANEKDFNTPWVMEAIGMLAPHQRVFAAMPSGSARFPTLWEPRSIVPAEDVTSRYHALARQWYAQNGVPEGYRKIMVDVQPRPLTPRAIVVEDESGQVLDRAFLPTPVDDVRHFATLLYPRGTNCYLRMEDSPLRSPLQEGESAVRLIRLAPAAP